MSYALRDFKRLAGKGIVEFGMISDAERILVCLSGGKDSLAMLACLHERLPRIPITYDLFVAHLDLGYEEEGQTRILKEYVENLGLPHHFETTDYAIVAHSDANRENPCYLCSRLRRKRLFEIAREHGCTKIALGHHRDDLIETLLMNILFSGEISTMKPVQEFFGGLLTVIRPLCMVPEESVRKVARAWNLPVIGSRCPSDGNSKRRVVKDIIGRLAAENPKIKGNMFNSLRNYRPEYLLPRPGGTGGAENGSGQRDGGKYQATSKEPDVMDSDQRKRTRVSFKASVDITAGDRVLKGLATRDLSLKGIYVITGEKLDLGTPVDIDMELTGISSVISLKMKGLVARLDGNGMGLDFVEVDLDSFYHLRNIVLYNAGDPDGVDNELVSKPAF